MRRGQAAPHGGALSAAIPFGWRIRALAATALVPPLLEFVSFARMERALSAAAQRSGTPAPADDVAALWVDRHLHRLPNPWALTCLRRAAVLYYLLRADGRAIDLCIGVRRDEHGELLAHAWLLHEGAVYLEPAKTKPQVPLFQLIAQFPQRP